VEADAHDSEPAQVTAATREAKVTPANAAGVSTLIRLIILRNTNRSRGCREAALWQIGVTIISRNSWRAKGSGWIAFFEKAGKDYKFSTDILMAIASRETNMRNIIGDGGHGFGIMQIDSGSYPDWCHAGLWKDVNAAIQQGALVFDSKREMIRNGQGKTLKIRKPPTTFTGKPNLTNAELLRTAIAAYNGGLWAYWGLCERDDQDWRTTGKIIHPTPLRALKSSRSF